MNRIYFIGDTNFEHENIIKYCNRPYKTASQMNEDLIEKWNKVVDDTDIVYHLGDFTINAIHIKDLIKRLNGKIYLIRGNHDGKSISFYQGVGLEVLKTQTKLEQEKLILSHKPLRNEQIPDGYINIHGHIHNKKLNTNIFDERKHICVSVEVINYQPVELEKLEKNQPK